MSGNPQLALPLPPRGGKRKGAGRKAKGDAALVSHKARPKFERVTPAHVTLRVGERIPSLRSAKRFAGIRQCIRAANARGGLRVVEFSVLGNHLHLIVEADSSEQLSRGMQGLCIRVAKRLNTLLESGGRVFADHFHARLLRSPTELARAIHYVLHDAAHHFAVEDDDPCSSAHPAQRDVLAPARGWLLTVGWRRARIASR